MVVYNNSCCKQENPTFDPNDIVKITFVMLKDGL